MSIDTEELKKELRKMKPRQILYEIIKAEMQRRGRWKRLPRGKSIEQVKKYRQQ